MRGCTWEGEFSYEERCCPVELSTGGRGYPQKSAGYPHPEWGGKRGRGHIWEKKVADLPEVGVWMNGKSCVFR